MASSLIESLSIHSPSSSSSSPPTTPKRSRPDSNSYNRRESSPSPMPTLSKIANQTPIPKKVEASLQSLTTIILPPLPHVDLPPLPPIHDQHLLQQVFTHTSYLSRPRRGIDFWALEEGSWDNEKLEFVGDGLLGVLSQFLASVRSLLLTPGAIINRLLHSLWPNLQQGASTVLKSHLVSNFTLSQISIRYNLPSRLRTEPSQRYQLQQGEKSTANLFEAYIVGVYESYMRHGDISSPPTDQSSFPASGFGVTEGQRRTANSKRRASHACNEGEAFEHIGQWLRPLFTPIARWTLAELQKEQQRLAESSGPAGADATMDENALGAMARLNEWFIHKGAGMPNYEDYKKIGDLWRVKVVATMADGTLRTAEATKTTKKMASTVAAYSICQDLGLIKA